MAKHADPGGGVDPHQLVLERLNAMLCVCVCVKQALFAVTATGRFNTQKEQNWSLACVS